jgi:hypothetical protein
MRTLYAIIFIALHAISTGASSQNDQKKPVFCPLPAEISPQHLYGTWHAELNGQHEAATVVFEKHPELAGSVSGRVTRAGVSAQIAGDVDDGAFTLEESLDGEHISATWLGTVVENTCGKEIKGTWNNAINNSALPFVLRRQAGW